MCEREKKSVSERRRRHLSYTHTHTHTRTHVHRIGSLFTYTREMEVVGSTKRSILAEGQAIDSRLSMYNTPPDQSVSLEEFEQFAYVSLYLYLESP